MIRFPMFSRVSGATTAACEVIRVLRQRKIDIVLLYGLPTIGVQTVLATKFFGVPVAFRAIDVSHQLVPNRALVPATKVLEKIVFTSFDLNIALTPRIAQYIQSYGVSNSVVRLLPSGVDTPMFSPGPRNPELMAKWHIAPEDKVVLFMGTIYPFSGLDSVIDGFRSVVSKHKNTKLLIVGNGVDEGRLHDLSRRTGVEQCVIFTGLQPYSVLPDVIRSSDVCINPFQLNGVTRDILPTKLFQYMAC